MFKLSSFNTFSKYIVSASDDIIDKVHYFFTTSVLLFCAMVIGTKQTYGTPMQCITSASFPGEWSNYVNSYCFVSGTYVFNLTNDVMPDFKVPEHEKVNIGYYQWVPYVLVCQSFLFFLPHLLWNITQKFSDIDFNHLVEECGKLHEVNSLEDKKNKSTTIVNILFSVAKYRNLRKAGAITGAVGFLAYFFSKMLHLVNVCLQLTFLYSFVGRENFYWGYKLLHNGLHGVSWNETGYFQRVSFCDFRQNTLGGSQDYTVQCLLMMNMLNEKLFVLLYFWFWILIVFSIANLFYLAMCMNKEFWMSNGIHSKRFLFEMFGLDGELLVYFIRNRTSMLDVSKLLNVLYEMCAKNGFVERSLKPKKTNFVYEDKSEEEKNEHYYNQTYKKNLSGIRFCSGFEWIV